MKRYRIQTFNVLVVRDPDAHALLLTEKLTERNTQ